jgi:hypothetical protein
MTTLNLSTLGKERILCGEREERMKGYKKGKGLETTDCSMIADHPLLLLITLLMPPWFLHIEHLFLG